MDKEFVYSVKFPLIEIDVPQSIKAIEGTSLETVTHQMVNLALTISGSHQELLTFLVISSPSSAVVLGLPWLKLHNPRIDWVAFLFVSWSTYCHAYCLCSAVPVSHSKMSSVLPPDLSAVPQKASSLPPH